MIRSILRRNTSRARIAGFILSNFIGLVIILGGLQFYLDASSIWLSKDSFVSSDLLVVNKRVTSAATLGGADTGFSEEEIRELRAQPWVRDAAPFTANAYLVNAAVRAGGRGLSTEMFFEAIPDSFVDLPHSQWIWREGEEVVPIILPKDYLALYNFGFAGAAGLPQVSEGLMSSIPLELTLSNPAGQGSVRMHGRIAGFSNRINTILVPETFMKQMNSKLGDGDRRLPRRIAIDTNSPGDAAIGRYLESHGMEVAGDKSASSAAYLLRVVTGIVIGVGIIITILSLSIIMLSVSLIMERNKSKIHQLLMLGYPAPSIAKPYEALTLGAGVVSLLLALAGVYALRFYYLAPVKSLGADPGAPWLMPLVGVAITVGIVTCNWASIRRAVRSAFRNAS